MKLDLPETTYGAKPAPDNEVGPRIGPRPANILKKAAAKIGRRFRAASVSFVRIPDTGGSPVLFHEWTLSGVTSNGQPHQIGSFDQSFLETLSDGQVAIFETAANAAELAGLLPADRLPSSALFAPYVSNGHLQFLLIVQKAAPYGWKPDEISFLRDAAERIFLRTERAETELTQNTALGLDEAVLANLDEGVYTVDKAGLLVSLNHAGERILGWKLEELSGRSVHEVIHHKHPDGRPFPSADCPLMKVLLSGRSPGSLDCVFIRKDGSFVEVVCTASPLIVNGEVTGLILVFRDDSERKMAERRLRESEERFVKFMQNLPGLAWIKDSQGRYVFVNDAAEKVFKRKKHELYGRNDFEVFPESVAADFVQNDRRAAEEGQLQTIEILADESGDLRHSIVNKFLVPSDRGNHLIGGIAIDITEQIRLQAHQDFLFSISEKIRVSRDADKLLAEISQAFGEYLGLHRCLFNEIDLVNDIETVHRDYVRAGESIAGEHKISIYSPQASESMASGQTVVNRDSKIDPRTADLYESVYAPASERAYITVPMLRDGRWVASLWCSDDKPRNWTPQEIALVENIAERTWAAVERTRSEIALRESEDKYRTIFESIDEGFVIAEMIFDGNDKPIDYRFLEANPAFPRLTGLPNDALGRTARELVPDLENFWFETYGNVALTGEAVRFEHYSEPMERWFDVYASRVGGPDSRRVAIVFDNITERKAAERALRRAEERYRGLINQTVAGVAEADLTGNLISVNDRYCKILGRGREELMGLNIQDLTHPDDFEGFKLKIRRLIQTGENFDIEKRFLRPDGSTIWVYNSVFAVSSLDGRPYSIVAVVIDITERKRAEEALRDSEERYRAVVESQAEMLCRFLLDGTILFVNEAYAKTVDCNAKELEGLNFWDFISPEDRDSVREMLFSLTPDQPKVQIENRFETADGPRWTLWTNRGLVFDENEHPVEAQSSGIDITDRKLAEERLSESEERFRLATEAVQAIIYDWDIVNDSIERSSEVHELLGIGHDDPETRTNAWWRKRLHPDDALRAITLVEKAIASGAERFEDEYRIRHRDGSYIWVNDTGLLIRDDAGRAVRCVGSVTDVTERKRAEEALRESEQRFRYSSDAAPVLIWMSDVTGRCTWFNKRWLDFTGRTMAQEIGYGWTEGVHPDDRDRCVNSYNAGLEARREFSIEYRLRRADGEYRWVFETGVPRISPGGGFLGLIGSCVDIHDRRNVEAALRESEERLSLAQTAGNVGVWDWDIAGDKTYWSETTWKFYGENPSSVNPDNEYWSNHLHDDDREAVKTRLEKAVASADTTFRDEFRIKSVKGKVVWLEAIAKIVRDENGRALRMYGVNIDITERKLSEERIRRNQNELRLLTDSMPALIAYIDRTFKYRFVNERYAEWFGTPTDEILGKKVREVVGEKAFKSIKPMMTSTLAGRPVSFQTTLSYRDAGKRYVQVSYIPDVAEDGTVRGLYSLVSDLTDWKRSEELLNSSEQRVAMLMETVSDYAIFSVGTGGLIETWNVGAENIFGYAADEILGQPVEVLYPVADRHAGAPAAEMKNARRQGKAADERWLVRKDGSRFFASGVMMPLRIGRTLNGFVKIVSDLTDKKIRAERLQRAHDELELRVRDRTRDLAEVNEALRQEIEERERSEAVKIGLLHRIVSAQETERQRIARDIHDQLGQRLTALRLKLSAMHGVCDGEEMQQRVERLQEIARLLDSEVSFLASELRPNTLDDLGLEEALRAHAGDWSRHHEIEMDFHSNSLTVKRLGRDTEIHLYRIAQEALNNIAKHARATSVNLLLERTGDTLMLIVEDNGVGFDAKKASARRVSHGLGLIGMNERAALIGASIEIESIPGKGTTVFVRLPLAGRQKEE